MSASGIVDYTASSSGKGSPAAKYDTVYALHDFNAVDADELSLKAGDAILVLERDEEYEDGWWMGRNDSGAQGLFPANFTSTSRLIPENSLSPIANGQTAVHPEVHNNFTLSQHTSASRPSRDRSSARSEDLRRFPGVTSHSPSNDLKTHSPERSNMHLYTAHKSFQSSEVRKASGYQEDSADQGHVRDQRRNSGAEVLASYLSGLKRRPDFASGNEKSKQPSETTLTDRPDNGPPTPASSGCVDPLYQGRDNQTKHPENWTVDDVVAFVDRSGFTQYSANFRRHEISGDVLIDLDVNALKELEITALGKRYQIMNAINSLRDQFGMGPSPNEMRASQGRKSSAGTAELCASMGSRRPSLAAGQAGPNVDGSPYSHPTPPMPSKGPLEVMMERKLSLGGSQSFSHPSPGYLGPSTSPLPPNQQYTVSPSFHSSPVPQLSATASQVSRSSAEQTVAQPPNSSPGQASLNAFNSGSPMLGFIPASYDPPPIPDARLIDLGKLDFESPIKTLDDASGFGAPSSQWKKRHAALRESKFYLFKKHKTKCILVIDIRHGYKLIPDPVMKGHKPSFKLEQSSSRIAPGTRPKTYYFIVDDEKVFRSWVRMLTKIAIYHAQHESTKRFVGGIPQTSVSSDVEIIQNPREVIGQIRVAGIDIGEANYKNLAQEFIDASNIKNRGSPLSQAGSPMATAWVQPVGLANTSVGPGAGYMRGDIPPAGRRLPSPPQQIQSSAIPSPFHHQTPPVHYGNPISEPHPASLYPLPLPTSRQTSSPGQMTDISNSLNPKPSHKSQPPPTTATSPLNPRGMSHSFSQPAYYTPQQAPPLPNLSSAKDPKIQLGGDVPGWRNERIQKAWGNGSESDSDVEEQYQFPHFRGRQEAPRHYPDDVYVDWLNGHLDSLKLKVEDVRRDLRNGVLIVRFLERISHRPLPERLRINFHPLPQYRMDAVENMTIAFKFLKDLGVLVSSHVTIDDIVNGDEEKTFHLLEDMNRHFGGLSNS